MKTIKPDLKYYAFISREETDKETGFTLCTNSMKFSYEAETACIKAFEEYKKQYKNNLQNCLDGVKYVSFFNLRIFYSDELCNTPPCWTLAEIRVFLNDGVKLSTEKELELQENIKTLLESINQHLREKSTEKVIFTFGSCGHLALYDEFDIKFMIDN